MKKSVFAIVLATLLGSQALFAQQAQEQPATEAETPAAKTAGPADTAASKPEPEPEPIPETPVAATEDGKSPFDYQASEQISEDRPVSFPVDI
ncbi:MAG: hypothetical protein ABJ308_08590 [Halieaceae bacterium]